MALRILVVDDHVPVRRAIISKLAARADWQICGEASDGIDAIAHAKELRPDVILMDVSMPKMDGLQATGEIRRHLPHTKIVIVSHNDESVLRQQAEEVQADAYVVKDELAQQLIPTIAELFSETISRPSHPSPKNSDPQAFAWLQGGGEMGELIRNTDWAQTRLGPAVKWSPALRMMVEFLLANGFPQLLWWGPEFCSIYNDAYIPILGTKHPWALGRPVVEVWNEIWHILKPLIETPFLGGPATWMEDIPLEINRRGFFEETHFTIAYSPVPDESVPGGIGGVLATVHEITEKVVGERRVRALRDLGARSVEPKSAEEACIIIWESLSRHTKDIPFLLLYLLDEKRQNARRACCIGADQGDRGCPGSLDLNLATGEEIWPLSGVLATEDLQLVEDLQSKFNRVPQGPWSDAPTRAAILPIRSNIQHQLAGFMVTGLSSRLEFDKSYRDFLELMSTQIATTIASARAYEEERKRAETLAQINRAKTLFFSNVSHEFRTPLTLMLGPLEDTLACGNRLTQEHRNNLQVAHRNSLRLLKLVNTLLDFSRIEAGRLQASYALTDLAGLTRELASLFRSTIERAGLKLLVNCDPNRQMVYVDREMWEKIVMNLLSNAFKFTFKGEIEVSLKKVGEAAELRVRDTGTGIPEQAVPHLFERFYRVQGARGRTWEGSGIGLALVQELVKLHGGSVRVESQIERGSTFLVTVPLGKDHLPADRIGVPRTLVSTGIRAEAYVQEALHWSAGMSDISDDAEIAPLVSMGSASLEPERKSQEVPRVLLADDNADMRQYLARLLSSRFRVTVCEDGQIALEQSRQARPDLVLADVMMPRLDGFGLLRALREDKDLRDVPVILLSARAGEESQVEGLDAGADDYMVKPFSARELMARIGAHLAMAKVRREAAELKGRNAEMLRQAEHVRELSWRLLRAQDEERRHIARELHDSAGQTLTVLGLSLAKLIQETASSAPGLATEMEAIQETVQQLHGNIRTASYLLHPPLLDENGLYSALSWYVQGLGKRSSLDIKLEMSREFGRLPRDMELVVFRVIQECLTNIHRHSGSETANIRVARENGQVVLEVRDRGQGMSPQRLAEIQSAGSGVGIRGMRERLSQFHGEMKIESDNTGTRVLVSIPVPPSGAERQPAAESLPTAV